jgi:hypothetical protein
MVIDPPGENLPSWRPNPQPALYNLGLSYRHRHAALLTHGTCLAQSERTSDRNKTSIADRTGPAPQAMALGAKPKKEEPRSSVQMTTDAWR